MNSISNEMLFYGGLLVAIACVILGVLYAGVYTIGKKRLNSRLDEEYGKQPKKKKQYLK